MCLALLLREEAALSQKKTVRRNPFPRALRARVHAGRLWLPALLLLALAAGGLTGLFVAYQLNHSHAAEQVATLATYQPNVVTRVYADDGETVIGEFALERRIPLKYAEIPPVVRNAILAVEDVRFYEHMGVDPIRVLGAAFKNLTTGSREGGSTLTQQLAKNLFLSPERTYSRKLREMLLALQIERSYTKEQIMEMYANHIFLGANSYGIEAGAETYFGKHARDLTLEEAALLAAIPKAPSRYSPTANPDQARARRNLVLDLMARHGFVSREEAEAAKARPVKLIPTAYYPPRFRSTDFDYPLEEVRQYLESKYTTRVAHSGLRVYTTINVHAQTAAVESVRRGLRDYDRTHARRRPSYRNIADEYEEGLNARKLEGYQHPHWYGNDFRTGRYVMGLVMEVDGRARKAQVRFGDYAATVTSSEMGRAGRNPADEFKVGDLAEFLIRKVDEERRRLEVELSQVPEVQGSLMTLNAKTGAVMAMVGGYDFTTNKFNNATQAYRQTGSVFKPFIYTAAIEWGMSPETKVSGEPIVFNDGHTVWRPHNYDGSLGGGEVPLKDALARSLNVQAVRLMQEVGVQAAAQMVRRFGITAPMAPYLPSALGATEVPLAEMVSAYSAFANSGLRARPHLVRRVVDRDGNTLEEWSPSATRVTSEYVALTMSAMMRGVVEHGTAQAAQAIGRPLAGKTGTVNDHTDVWFIGYTPTYVTGVWMGYPGEKRSLGPDMTGSRGALPIFVDFMKDFLKDKPVERFPEPPSTPREMQELYELRQKQMEDEKRLLALIDDLKNPADAEPTTPQGIEDDSTATSIELDPINLPSSEETDGEEARPDSQPPALRPRLVETSAEPANDAARSGLATGLFGPTRKGKRGGDEDDAGGPPVTRATNGPPVTQTTKGN
jgi:penicillin-binding protein 1A